MYGSEVDNENGDELEGVPDGIQFVPTRSATGQARDEGHVADLEGSPTEVKNRGENDIVDDLVG